MQLSKMPNEIYRSLVTKQYHTKCTNPLYPKFTSNKFSAYNFCCNLYLVIACVLIPTTDKCLHPFISHCPLIMGQLLQQKAQIWHTRANMTTNWQSNTENNCKIRCQTFEGEPAMVLEPVIVGYKR